MLLFILSRSLIHCGHYKCGGLQESPSFTVTHASLIGPALAECLKDGSTPVRLAAERCALHCFQLTKGICLCFVVFNSLCMMKFFDPLIDHQCLDLQLCIVKVS